MAKLKDKSKDLIFIIDGWFDRTARLTDGIGLR